MADTSKTTMEELQQFEPDVFWEQHGKKIIVAALAALAAGVGIYLWQRQVADQAEQAASRLAAAQDVNSLQQLVQDYAGKQPAAQALLRLADMEFQAGRYAEAAASYQKFLNQFSSHPFAESASVGLAAVAEAQGNFQEAQKQYAQVIALHPQGYTAQTARLGQARCLEMLGQIKEARQLYEEISAAGQGTPWASSAYVRWVILGRDLPPEPPKPVEPAAPNGQPGLLPAPAGTQPPLPVPTPQTEPVK